jgi:UDP-N-acetylmuramoyl-tripeptide--D-alanyl-D-alanine ligase
VTIPQILVSDVVVALGQLAKFVLAEVRKSGQLKVIGITGSNGKTTTKNMLRAILSQVGPTVAPIESYNNEVGAPISVLKINQDTRFLVAELGAGGPGSIAYLTKIVQPDVVVELKVGMAHAGEFGGIETTATIKAELLKEAPGDSIAVLNADDTYVRQMAIDVKDKAVWFGTQPGCDYWASDYELDMDGTSFDLHWPAESGTDRIKLQILGEHHVMNALASAAVAEQLGAPRLAIPRPWRHCRLQRSGEWNLPTARTV